MNNSDEWRKAVKQRDGNVCRKCRIRRYPHAHHIMPKAKYPEFELEVDNGITLCGNCHSLLKGKEEEVNIREFLSPDTEINKQINKQLRSIVELIKPRFERAAKDIREYGHKLQLALTANETIDFIDKVGQVVKKYKQYERTLSNFHLIIDKEQMENHNVISEIRSLYRDENDLFRTITKRIWEQWNAQLQQWDLRRIEFIFEDPELPLPSDNPAIAVEQRHGWLIPPEWEFLSEVWEYERKPVPETVYDHESEVDIIR